VLILGYGNPLRGDDAMGPAAAERLGGIAVHQLTPELAERIAAADTVIFLDADATLPPGEIAVKAVEPADTTLDHHATPAGLLRLARMVYGAAPRAWLIGMGGEDFDLREGLSAAAERAIERAVAFVTSRS
jgi:hydrogenase maturation protease